MFCCCCCCFCRLYLVGRAVCSFASLLHYSKLHCIDGNKEVECCTFSRYRKTFMYSYGICVSLTKIQMINFQHVHIHNYSMNTKIPACTAPVYLVVQSYKHISIFHINFRICLSNPQMELTSFHFQLWYDKVQFVAIVSFV